MQGKKLFAEGHATTFKDVSYDLQLKMIFLNDTANLAFEPIGVFPARVLDKAWWMFGMFGETDGSQAPELGSTH